jgi:hypothetical protein
MLYSIITQPLQRNKKIAYPFGTAFNSSSKLSTEGLFRESVEVGRCPPFSVSVTKTISIAVNTAAPNNF